MKEYVGQTDDGLHVFRCDDTSHVKVDISDLGLAAHMEQYTLNNLRVLNLALERYNPKKESNDSTRDIRITCEEYNKRYNVEDANDEDFLFEQVEELMNIFIHKPSQSRMQTINVVNSLTTVSKNKKILGVDFSFYHLAMKFLPRIKKLLDSMKLVNETDNESTDKSPNPA